MNDAELSLRLREDRFYRFGKTFESIHADDEDIPHAPVLQLRDDLERQLAPSACPSQIPKTSLFPASVTPIAK